MTEAALASPRRHPLAPLIVSGRPFLVALALVFETPRALLERIAAGALGPTSFKMRFRPRFRVTERALAMLRGGALAFTRILRAAPRAPLEGFAA
jgi:hypothetical protein